MTLEVLFAREMQTQAFLLMTAAGVVIAGLVQLAGFLHGVNRAAGVMADALCAMAAAAAVMHIAMQTGGGLRGYGLLGLCIGAVLYSLGAAPVINGTARLVRKIIRREAGKQASHAESTPSQG
ncbi:MAG: hypothetical protein IJ438_13255 [Clostridia bacterium]|nr:hypothetical protein [Clostridia bacterium]